MAKISIGSKPQPSTRCATYQEAEVLEAESWGLVDVVHQAARGGHHYVNQAAEAVCSEEQNDSAKGPMPTPQHHWEPAEWVQIAASYSLRSPSPTGPTSSGQDSPVP